jgi:predicted dehydrogenase
MSLGTLIIGLGQIGMGYDLRLDGDQFVYSQARAFSRHPAFHLIGGVEFNAGRRDTFEREYHCAAFPDLETALATTTPEVVVIAVPTLLHATTLRSVLELSRPRVVLCEKPLAYDLAEAQSMVDMCEAAKTQLFVNYIRRADPGVVEVKRRLASGEMVVPVKGVVWYSKGFAHNGSHFVNLLEYWLGPVLGIEVLDVGRQWGDSDREPDVRLTFSGGPVVFLSSREEDFSHYTVELLVSNGRLRYERGGRMIEWQGVEADPQLAGYTVLSPQVDVIPTGMDRYQWHVADQLSAALDGKPAHLCSGVEALQTMQTLHATLTKTPR